MQNRTALAQWSCLPGTTLALPQQPYNTTLVASADTLVVGGGIIGLATAWKAASRGLSVALIDPSPGQGTSRVAAGMLAPVSELHYGEERLLELNIASAQRYPQFVAELEDAAGRSVGYRRCGTLIVAAEAGDKDQLTELCDYQRSFGLASSWLGSRECRAEVPFISPAIQGGILAADDHQVDTRKLLGALLAATINAGVRVLHQRAERIIVSRSGCAEGAVLESGGRLLAGTTVLAAGCWSGAIGEIPPHAACPIRPVKGQILRLKGPLNTEYLRHTIRGVVNGSPVYLVPRADGRIVVGATSEERGFDTTVTAGAVHDILRDARQLFPQVTELELVEARSGLRPGTPDNRPFAGESGLAGLLFATGHQRNGVLLTPLTADTIVSCLTADAPEDPAVANMLDYCSPARAHPAPAHL